VMKSKQFICCMVPALILLAGSHTLAAYAGSINGNEQQVIGVAQGRFEKDGTVYQVKQEYIDSLVSYLSQDDVDLTAEDCQAAIAEIYANVSTGVESGYLSPVGKTESPTSPSNSSAPDTEAGKTKPVTGGKVEAAQEAQVTQNAAPGAADRSSPSQAEQDNLATLSSAEKLPKPQAIIGLESFSKIGSGGQVDMGRDTAALMKKVKIPVKEGLCLLTVLTLLLAVTAGISSYKKAF